MFVRRPTFDKAMFRFFRYELGGAIPESRILSRNLRPAGASVARFLNTRESDDVIHMHRLRLHGGKPFLVEDIWLEYACFAPVFEVPTEELGDLLYPMYESMCSILQPQEASPLARLREPGELQVPQGEGGSGGVAKRPPGHCNSALVTALPEGSRVTVSIRAGQSDARSDNGSNAMGTGFVHSGRTDASTLRQMSSS